MNSKKVSDQFFIEYDNKLELYYLCDTGEIYFQSNKMWFELRKTSTREKYDFIINEIKNLTTDAA